VSNLLGTYNFASQGEHYFFTYSKLKELLSIQNGEIRTIALGVSAHSFSPMFNDMFDINSKAGKYSLRKYSQFFNTLDNEFLSLFELIRNIGYFIDGIFRGADMGGNYESLANTPSDSTIRRSFISHFGTSSVEIENKSQKKYVQLIIDACKAKNINIILVSMPVHSKYKSQVSSYYFGQLNEIISINKEIRYINFLNEDSEDKYFSDGNHLNNAGAKKYTDIINQKLKE
jgi:hypothetical protein